MLDLIDRELFPPEGVKTSWDGTATELESILCESGKRGVARKADKLLSIFPRACGTYLGRLEKQTGRVTRLPRSGSYRKWRIECPKPEYIQEESNAVSEPIQEVCGF